MNWLVFLCVCVCACVLKTKSLCDRPAVVRPLLDWTPTPAALLLTHYSASSYRPARLPSMLLIQGLCSHGRASPGCCFAQNDSAGNILYPHQSPHMPPFKKSTWTLSLVSPLTLNHTWKKNCSQVNIFTCRFCHWYLVVYSDKPNLLDPTVKQKRV